MRESMHPDNCRTNYLITESGIVRGVLEASSPADALQSIPGSPYGGILAPGPVPGSWVCGDWTVWRIR